MILSNLEIQKALDEGKEDLSLIQSLYHENQSTGNTARTIQLQLT